MIYHVPFDGRNTDKSAFPSPSKSKRASRQRIAEFENVVAVIVVVDDQIRCNTLENDKSSIIGNHRRGGGEIAGSRAEIVDARQICDAGLHIADEHVKAALLSGTVVTKSDADFQREQICHRASRSDFWKTHYPNWCCRFSG